MHYYQFNIKSHSYATKHLSNMEDLAYRRLLDLYYDGEEPLLNDVKKLAKKIGMRDFQSEIDEVLSEFFLVEGDTFRHEKADKEIAVYHSKADTARVNGKKGGRPKKTQSEPNPNPKKPRPNPEITQSVNLANPEESGLKANHKPLTNNQEPVTIKQEPVTKKEIQIDFVDQDAQFEIFWNAGMVKTGKKKARSIFQKLAAKRADSEIWTEQLEYDIKRRLSANQMGFAAMHPSTYLNGERWEDDAVISSQAPKAQTREQQVTDANQATADYYANKNQIIEGEFNETNQAGRLV